jgi:hypothetical protein
VLIEFIEEEFFPEKRKTLTVIEKHPFDLIWTEF